MLRIAFSTVACPDWSLDRVASCAAEWGYTGVELRSFGGGGTEMACDPALTDTEKVRALFSGAGVDICSIATGVRFDTPVRPPVIGHVLLDRDASIYEGRRFVELMRAVGAETTRVYGYSAHGNERRSALIRRVADRLRFVCDVARHDAGDVVIENGGSFSSAEDLLEIADVVNHPKLGFAYDVRAAVAAGDDPALGAAMLDDRLRLARVRDARNDEARALVQSATRATGGRAWIVFDWAHLWDRTLAPAEAVLPDAAARLMSWVGEATDDARVA